MAWESGAQNYWCASPMAFHSSYFSSRYQKFCRCLDRPGWSRQSQPRCSRHRPRACGFCVVRMARSFSGEVGAGPYILCIYIHSDPLLLSFFLFLLFYTFSPKHFYFSFFYFVPTFYVVACLLQPNPPPSFLPAANRLRERELGGEFLRDDTKQINKSIHAIRVTLP